MVWQPFSVKRWFSEPAVRRRLTPREPVNAGSTPSTVTTGTVAAGSAVENASSENSNRSTCPPHASKLR